MRTIATAGAQAKVEQDQALGAHHAINYRDEAFLPRVMEITGGKGVDIVFEHVGGEVFTNSVAALGIGGRVREPHGGPGNLLRRVGADTGRDGIHGASGLASRTFEEERELRPTVQVGNPFLEKVPNLTFRNAVR